MWTETHTPKNFHQGLVPGDNIIWERTGDRYLSNGWEIIQEIDEVTGFDWPFILLKKSPTGIHYSRFKEKIDYAGKDKKGQLKMF